jgi:hypothetical protein
MWQQHLPGQHLPYSAVEVPFLPVPGCTVQLDLWVYVPGAVSSEWKKQRVARIRSSSVTTSH